jgi:hypothetical protein
MFGLGLIVLLAIVIAVVAGVAGKRPGLAVGFVGLMLFGLMTLVMLYSFRSMPQMAPPAVGWSESHGPVSVSWSEDAMGGTPAQVLQVKSGVSFVAVLMVAGAAVAVMFVLFRRSGSACVPGQHRGLWPAALLLLLLPLVFFVGTRHVRKSVSHSNRFDAEMAPPVTHERIVRQQAELERRQAEIARQTSELSSELQHRIDNMEIHKLMDLVDAPRIMLPIPTPATIALWSKAATASAEPAEQAPVQAEADPAVGLIAAEGDNTDAAAPSDVEPESEGEAASAAGIIAASTSEHARRARPALPADPAEPRPSWVSKPAKRVGNVRRDVVTTDEYATVDECYWAADRLLQLKTYEHIQRLLGTAYDSNRALDLRSEALSVEGDSPWVLTQLNKAGITVDYIHREIAKDEYLEKVERSFGPMLKLYTLIEFPPSIDSELRQRWEASQRQERFASVGFGATSILGLLGLAWGLLKVDTWTKGYYTKRLFIGVPLGMLGLLGLLTLIIETLAGY